MSIDPSKRCHRCGRLYGEHHVDRINDPGFLATLPAPTKPRKALVWQLWINGATLAACGKAIQRSPTLANYIIMGWLIRSHCLRYGWKPRRQNW